MAVDDAYTKALLHFEGANNSTYIRDESGKIWTRTGSAVISTTTKKFGVSCGKFTGINDGFDSADSPDWQLDGGSNSNQWTVDFWVNFGDLSNGTYPLPWGQYDDAGNMMLFYAACTEGFWGFEVWKAGVQTTMLTFYDSITTNTWYHIALVKQGTTGYKLFRGGTQVDATLTDIDPLPNLTSAFGIGTLVGYMDEFRVSKGIARWTSNFTPPTAKYGTSFIPKIIHT